MALNTTEIKAQALAEIAKIKDAAVAEYLTLKTGHYSATVLAVVAGVALVLGAILGHAL